MEQGSLKPQASPHETRFLGNGGRRIRELMNRPVRKRSHNPGRSEGTLVSAGKSGYCATAVRYLTRDGFAPAS